MQRAVAHGIAVDGVRVDELQHLGRRLAEQRQDPFAVVRSEPLHDVARQEPQAGVDQTDVAPRAAEADLDRLEGDHLRPRLGEPQRRREPRIAAADDRDVGANLALERRGRRRRGSSYFPKAVRERIVLHVVRCRDRFSTPAREFAMSEDWKASAASGRKEIQIFPKPNPN